MQSITRQNAEVYLKYQSVTGDHHPLKYQNANRPKYQKADYTLILWVYFDTLALAEIKVKVQTFLLESLRPVQATQHDFDHRRYQLEKRTQLLSTRKCQSRKPSGKGNPPLCCVKSLTSVAAFSPECV